MRSVGGKIAGSFGLGLLILVVIGLLAFTSLRKMINANYRVVHINQEIETLEEVLTLLDDAETGQRGYVISGEQRYLEPYEQSHKAIAQRLRALRVLLRDNPQQGQRLDRLTFLINSRFSELQQTIDLRQGAGGFAAARALVLTDRGRKIMDDIRTLVAEMEREEEQRLAQREKAAEADARTTLALIAIGVPLHLHPARDAGGVSHAQHRGAVAEDDGYRRPDRIRRPGCRATGRRSAMMKWARWRRASHG